MTTLRQAAQAALEAINFTSPPGEGHQSAMDRFTEAHDAAVDGLTLALAAPEQDGEIKVLQAKCDAFLANMQLALDELAAMTAERDEYQRAADSMAMSHKVERDELMAAAKLALEVIEDALSWVESAHRPPVPDTFEFGRMVLIRLHALASLKDVAEQLRKGSAQ